MVYNVIGLMSGSSLDGLDIAFVEITEIGGKWSFQLIHSDCIEYPNEWQEKLKNIASMPMNEYFRTHTAYGRYIGEVVNQYITDHELTHKVHLISSHGHTVFHDPKHQTTVQLGDGATISAVTQLNVVSDLRQKDVALFGQGAPIVPIADQYFWKDYDFCLNIGGIANITINGTSPIAFDICTANQVLNHLARILGQEFDSDGALAAQGTILVEELEALNSDPFFKITGPKSLSNDFSKRYIDILSNLDPIDSLTTMVEHIALQISAHIIPHISHPSQKLLITGGGAHNSYLISRINHHLEDKLDIQILEKNIIDYKEAIAMALIGVLRWREENNVLSSVTGAKMDSVGGALWVN